MSNSFFDKKLFRHRLEMSDSKKVDIDNRTSNMLKENEYLRSKLRRYEESAKRAINFSGNLDINFLFFY